MYRLVFHCYLVGILLLAFPAAGCKKSAQEQAEQQALKRHAQEVEQRHKQIAAIQNMEKSPGGRATMEAVRYLIHLHGQGQLPGSKNIVGLQLNDQDQSATYPIMRHFTAQLRADPSRIHFTLVKPSDAASWRLQKAWRTDEQGNIVENFTVPANGS